MWEERRYSVREFMRSIPESWVTEIYGINPVDSFSLNSILLWDPVSVILLQSSEYNDPEKGAY